jgi:phage baseplate assembly protein gpV
VTDNTGLTFEKTFTIHIDDVGERPTDIALSGNTIREGVETETVVGFLSSADPDSGSTFIYTLEDDAGGRFMLGADGRSIVVADGARLDYETDAFHTITVRVSDGTYTFDKAFTITVEDLAEAIGNRAPTDIVLAGGAKGNATVDENAEAEVVVGSLAASDADTGDSFTYTLLDDAGGRFRLDESGAQILVADGNLIDYEVASSYTIRVQVSDGKGGVFTKNIAIGANDVNEKPTDITLSGPTASTRIPRALTPLRLSTMRAGASS